jgi:hypothetical protein
MSGIFKEVFTKPEFSLEDFLDHGYATVSSNADTILIATLGGSQHGCALALIRDTEHS